MTSTVRSLLLILAIAACAGGPRSAPAPAPDPKPTGVKHGPPPTKTACDAGDTAIATSTECLQDNAACYQLVDSSWCTGGRPGTPDGTGGNHNG